MAQISKADFINEIALHNAFANTTKKDVTSVINTILDNLTAHLAEGNTVNLSGFGSFSPVARAARTAKVPGTDKIVKVPAKVAAKFKPAKALKNAVNK
jgi:DNA-binding protein HU-beta